MIDLITSYLFTHKVCPLPNVGTLYLGERSARLLQGEHKIAGPEPYIEFRAEQIPATQLVDFIAKQQAIPAHEAAARLEAYCAQLRQQAATGEKEIPGAGSFFVNENGELSFGAQEIAPEYLPPVNAERVIHPNESHQMLVGDRETNTTLMSEYLTVVEPPRKRKWWIAAILLFLVAAIAIILYFNSARRNENLGNASPIKPATEKPTYTTGP